MKTNSLIFSILLLLIITIGCKIEGPEGKKSLIDFVSEPAGNNCSNGGYKVLSGIDLNNNNILDNTEVQSTQFICNGIDGTDGINGYNSLINVLAESAGENCSNGGYKILTGLDTNINGTLDESEIQNTQYICNGNDGINSLFSVETEPAGENCEAGGFRISYGKDLNGNGILDDIEIENFVFICNGTCPVLKTVVFQPGPEEGIDAYVASSIRYQDSNFGGYYSLLASGWTDVSHDSPNNNSRILINFEFLKTLSSSKIESVKLTLYSIDDYEWDNGGQYGENASAIYVVTEEWQENEVTWNTQPAYSTIDSVIIPQNNDYDSVMLDITDLTKEMLQYKYGFLIKQIDENPYSSMVFSSSDFPTKEKWPKLTIEYWD